MNNNITIIHAVLQKLTNANRDGLFYTRLRHELIEDHPDIPSHLIFTTISEMLEDHVLSFTESGALKLILP
jgi:hypothetical protein